ncbi:MAG: nucleotide exchange factor GrpE [Chloroflexota bacterium]|nr:nucleotide exchange factor GrpE [Chloroflexota bacterium]
MSSLFDLIDPQRDPRANRRPTLPDGQPLPTLEDYQRLAQSYSDLRLRFIEQSKTLDEKTKQTAIKDEVIQRQSVDIRQLETEKNQASSELVFTKAALEQTKKRLSEAADENWQERYQQFQVEAQTELDNLRKRWEGRFVTESTEARHRILLDMLPLADHLDLALQHTSASDDKSVQSFVSNIEATRRAFMETLRRYGVEAIDAVGQPFNPNLHEAVTQITAEGIPADQIVQVVQAGYMDGNKLLRPARVIVSQA